VTKKQKSEKAVNRIDLLDGDDPDKCHGDADDIVLSLLRDLGYPEVVDAYSRLVDRCEYWATA